MSIGSIGAILPASRRETDGASERIVREGSRGNPINFSAVPDISAAVFPL